LIERGFGQYRDQFGPTELVAIAEDLDAVADLRERALELRRLTDGEPGADPGRRSPLTVVA
jgi:hypothetical protein